jgi:hypothetical protein
MAAEEPLMGAKTFAEHLRESRRLTLLRLLHESPGYTANSSVLHAGIGQFGFASSRDDVHTDLAWLGEQALVELEDLGPVVVATLTERGADAACGRAIVPGVQRPRPR